MTGRWEPIGPVNAFSLIGLRETLLGGQSFSWSAKEEDQWIGVIENSVVELRWIAGQLQWRCSGPVPLRKKELLHYLWLDDSYFKAVDSLPWRSDETLHQAIQRFPGLRILRQPIEETLMVFLLSSAKSIPQIKKLRAKTNQLLGDELIEGMHAFPGWHRLKGLSEKEARSLGMGYRAKYLVGTARHLEKNPQFLQSLRKLPYSQARLKLMELPGVGPKVADCVLLFGGQKNQAFPIDTWILQSLKKQYSMSDWKISQMQEFARIHFGQHAGLAQQFLFSYQRILSQDTEQKEGKI